MYMPVRSKKHNTADRSVELLFDQYKEEGHDCIGLSTIVRFLGDLGISEDDIGGLRALWVMWRLGSVEMGIVNRREFSEGLNKMGVRDMEQLKSQIPKSIPQDLSVVDCKHFLEFAFTYNLEGGNKCLDKETTAELLSLFYPDKATRVYSFMKFLNQPRVERLRKDEWVMLYDLFRMTKDDMSDYETDSTWPLLFDDYYEWVKSQ